MVTPTCLPLPWKRLHQYIVSVPAIRIYILTTDSNWSNELCALWISVYKWWLSIPYNCDLSAHNLSVGTQIANECSIIFPWLMTLTDYLKNIPDSKVHGANMGPTWVLSAPDGPDVGPMKLAIRDYRLGSSFTHFKIMKGPISYYEWLNLINRKQFKTTGGYGNFLMKTWIS